MKFVTYMLDGSTQPRFGFKKNEYIIYRHQYKFTKNRGTMNRRGTKKKRDTTKRKRDTTKRKRGKRSKGLFNIF